MRFERISYTQASDQYHEQERFLKELQGTKSFPPSLPSLETIDQHIDPRLHETPYEPSTWRPRVVFRQAGDSAILIEFGEMELDFAVRARIHAFETEIRARALPGVWFLAPCIRSTMVSNPSGMPGCDRSAELRSGSLRPPIHHTGVGTRIAGRC